ncbi:hypothetical protein BTVI_98259 [Pitangus sulphuratus]|nr:hypothetical protein BTVI_98259 [Pitangus sulphuratus]
MSGTRCQALYPFSGERHRQGLRFAAGELITVLQVPDGGWWEGQKEDGLRGWFPASYVQLLEGFTFISIGIFSDKAGLKSVPSFGPELKEGSEKGVKNSREQNLSHPRAVAQQPV